MTRGPLLGCVGDIAFTDERGRGTPGQPAPCQGHFQSHWAAYLFFLGVSSPRRLGLVRKELSGQWEGGSLQVPSVDRWACCPAVTIQSYVRNEPASSSLPPALSGGQWSHSG